ncbi:hypothetical protein D3C85_1399950 [compost metagenome]
MHEHLDGKRPVRARHANPVETRTHGQEHRVAGVFRNGVQIRQADVAHRNLGRGGQPQLVRQPAQVIALGLRLLTYQPFGDHSLQQPMHRGPLQSGAAIQVDEPAAAAVVDCNDAQQRDSALQRLRARGPIFVRGARLIHGSLLAGCPAAGAHL